MSKTKLLAGAAKVLTKAATKGAATALSTGGKILASPVGSRAAGGLMAYDAIKTIRRKRKSGNTQGMLGQVAKAVAGGAMLLFNHDEWHNNYPLDGLVAANFARRVGITEKSLMNSDASENVSVPSASRINVLLTTPRENSNAWEQSINVMFGIIRSANAGAINYGPKDLGRYILATRDLFAVYFTARRAYAALRNFNSVNATEPASLFAAMGLDYETFRDNSADLYSWLNLFGHQIRTMAPIKMDLIPYTEWMFSNIFADSDDAKASKYAFSLGQAGYYNTVTDEWKFLNMSSVYSEILGEEQTGLSYDTFIDRAKTIIMAFQNNNTFMIIAGDILKAFGQEAVYNLRIPGDNEPTPVIYDEAALTKIQNATVCGKGFNLSRTRVDTPNDPIPLDTISVNRPSIAKLAPLGLFKSPFINSYKDHLTPAQLLSYTRFTMAYPFEREWKEEEPISSENGLVHGSEVVEFMVAFNRNTGSDNYMDLVAINLGYTKDPTGRIADNVLAWSSIDYAPLTMLQSENEYLGTLFDFNTYARVTDQEVGTYHAYDIMSLLAIPRLVKVSNTEIIK